MGAQASRDAEATATDQSDDLAARAWRTGEPFTLLHDEGFVMEKYQELLASSGVQDAAKKTSRALNELQTTSSGLDEVPMDEQRHPTDMARVKLFARKRREGASSTSRPGSPHDSGGSAASAGASGRENPPSALAGMVGNVLSRESTESLEDEKLRAQKDELLQVYYAQIATRMKQKQIQATEEKEKTEALKSEQSASGETLEMTPFMNEGNRITQGTSPASVFSVGSLRMQLEMLREFRVLSPRLFENGMMALVKTLLDCQPFVLCEITSNSPEEVLVEDVHKFCQELLSLHGDEALSVTQRQVLLLLLLALGVSSGRISLLLEFTDEMLRAPPETMPKAITSSALLQGHPFGEWVNVFLRRMQSYRIDFALGTFEENSFVKKFSVKTLTGDVDALEETSQSGLDTSCAFKPLTTDGTYAYMWSRKDGLVKVGTGLNFTIAGRVYADMPATAYLNRLNEKRCVEKLVYGFGEGATDVSDIAREEVCSESQNRTVHDIFSEETTDTLATQRLLLSYSVDGTHQVDVLTDADKFIIPASNVQVYRAWYGDLQVLSEPALAEFREQLGKSLSDSESDDGELGIVYSRELLDQLLMLSNVSLDSVSDTKALMVIFSSGSSCNFGAQVLHDGDRFFDEKDRAVDSYLSSLVFCGDYLYLSVLYSELDVSGMLTNDLDQRSRQLLRMSPQDLNVIEVIPLNTISALPANPPADGPAVPLRVYVTEGKLIYEIDMNTDKFNVTVFAPIISAEGGVRLDTTRSFSLSMASTECCEVASRLRAASTNDEGELDVMVPSFYTNGSSLGLLLVDPSSQENESSTKSVRCFMFDCQDGQLKALAENSSDGHSVERSLQLTSVCFDARNNFMWVYDDERKMLMSYQNTGKRISLDDSCIPPAIPMSSKQEGEDDQPGFGEATTLSLLGILYKNSISGSLVESHTLGRSSEDSSDSSKKIPFAVDVESATFQFLLDFMTQYVDIFKSGNATIVQGCILQACLGILNKNLEALLSLRDGPHRQRIIDLLQNALVAPLDKLLEFSSRDGDCTTPDKITREPETISQIDETIHVQVASVALDLYTTSIRIFHADVGKQFSHILNYLDLWKQSKATAMELKILSRLLAHVCTRVDAIYQTMIDSDDALERFAQLVEISMAMQKRQIQHSLIGLNELDRGSMLTPMGDATDSFELISLVNAISQAVFVAVVSSDAHTSRALDVGIAVFDILREACAEICRELANQVKRKEAHARWPQIETALNDGFVRVLAPVLVSSGVSFMRNHEKLTNMVLSNEQHNPINQRAEQDEMNGGNVNDSDLPSAVATRLSRFMQENSTKLLEFMKSLEVLISQVDSEKRQHVVESVSTVLRTETVESLHEYENNMDVLSELRLPGAGRMVITFDPRCRTEVNYDYLTFYKDKSQGEFYGSQYYSGRDSEQNWPGVGDNPPLIIESDHCFVYFHSDGSNTDWGYKFTASAEVLERKRSLQQHWLVFLLEGVVQMLDESISLLLDGSIFAPIDDVELLDERILQSDLLKSGVCTEANKNAEVLRLLQDFVDPPESSDAEKVINALLKQSASSRPGLALARSTSFDQITNSVPNKSVNSAVRAVAAAILHHNMWGMDAYAFTQNLRSDISEQLVRGWKNAQKMRDWFHLGDAADAGIHGQNVPSRRRSGRLRRQPSAYKGLSEESLAILCDNVVKRAQFLLEITPVSFAYVTGAKRRWGLLAKYGHAIGKHSSSDSQLDKWYNLLEELQAATELRSLFQYRRSSSERLKHGQAKSVTEQVLEFIQSDADVAEIRKVIATRNQRATSRALGMEIFVQTLKGCPSLRMKGILLESFASSLKYFAIAHSPATIIDTIPRSLVSDSNLPRVHFDTLLSGCDEALRQRLLRAFGNCLRSFTELLSSSSNSVLISGVLKCCAIDYDLEDSYLLQESQLLPQTLPFLSSESVPIRNAAQSFLGVLISRFIVGRVDSTDEVGGEDDTDNSGHDVSSFQKQLFGAVGHQLEDIVSVVKMSKTGLHGNDQAPQYLPENSPGLTSACLQTNAVTWNNSIMLWVYAPKKGPLYALKLGDEVRRGPSWINNGETDCENELGVVVSIPTPTKVLVKWNSTGSTSQCDFDPKNETFDVVLANEGAGGVIYFKGNKNLTKDSAAAKPWSYFGLFLTDKRELVYKIACGSDKENVIETDCKLDVDQWSHVAIVQHDDTVKVYVNGLMVSQHLLESFLFFNGNVNPAEAAIIESAHPLEDSIDEYCPVHIPGAVKIRLTFDPLCDIDSSTGFVRFYKDAQCVEFWGNDKYMGKYSDPERNFPGAQSNRARSQHLADEETDPDSMGLDVLEIPSDRFLVYFHNEGCSNSWGFRILASPEFGESSEERSTATPHLNPYPFYFGETPGRVLDEPAAKCWIYQPKVLSYSVSESDLAVEVQEGYPVSEDVLNCVSSDRILHALGLIRSCAETSFGRELISTPENMKSLMFLAFDERVAVEIRVGASRLLRDLIGLKSPDEVDALLVQSIPNEVEGFLSFVLTRIAQPLDIWRMFDEDTGSLPLNTEDKDGDVANKSVLRLRNSAQGEASLVATYVSLLRTVAGYSNWCDVIFDLLKSVLQSYHEWEERSGALSEDVVGRVLASLAILGGNYAGAYIGGRVSCCVNVDGKEMIETGFLVQFLLKNGTQMARVVFDCDQSNTVDVPLTDVAHLEDEEQAEIKYFLGQQPSFASELRTLFRYIITANADVPLPNGSYQPKRTKKENVEILESEHPYATGENVKYALNFRGANEIVIRFDMMSCTAGPNDYVQFKKRKEDHGDGKNYWGEEKYYGDSFPGVGTTPALHIPAGCVDVLFKTEGASSTISEWGFKLTAHAFEETLVYPPEVPPPVRISAMNDIRTRCIKSLRQILQTNAHGDLIPSFVPLLPSLVTIANAPCHGRPIQSSPKSQIFESKHPYANSVTEYMKVTFSGASTLTITFDPQSRTEQNCDYLCFFKDKSLTDRWGAYQYCGVGSEANWPGIDDRPPLVIPADSFTLLWFTDGSNVDWGWKFSVTAEFLPEFPLDKSLNQLDARCYRLFETAYEKTSLQRPPLKAEFDEFAESNESVDTNFTQDPIRQLLLTCIKSDTSSHIGDDPKQNSFRVSAENGLKVYREKDCESDVIAEISAGAEFVAEIYEGGWLKVTHDSQLGEDNVGWAWQRTGDTIHATSLKSVWNGEDLLALGVDDQNFESMHSVLEMDESNDEEKSLTNWCSPFAFDEFKGQTDRYQSLAYDSHRAMATKAAREAILTFLSCDPKETPISLESFGNVDDILLLLSRYFVGVDADSVYDSQSGVLLSLRRRLHNMVSAGVNDDLLCALLKKCMEILQRGLGLLPKGRGAVRILESQHPYQDNADQYWEVSIPGAKRIEVTFDRRSKSEAGCDWLRFYKSGSNRNETIGPDQIGGRAENENWPGTGDRPPLSIDGDSFEVYFHSDSSNSDWGFKLYAIGIFKEREENDSDNFEAVVELLSMACWLLEAVSAIPEHSFQNSPNAFSQVYSSKMLQTLALSLEDLPQCIKTGALQVLSNMTQNPAFHTIPVIYVEQVRDVIYVKMRAKYQAEDRVEVKSPYLQKLVQCAIALDLAIDSYCFGQPKHTHLIESRLLFQPGVGASRTFVSDPEPANSSCVQFQLVFRRLVPPISFGLVDKAADVSTPPQFSVQWNDTGELFVHDESSDSLIEVSRFQDRIAEGDAVIVEIDLLRQTLFVRKNSVLVCFVGGPAGSNALVPWEKFHFGKEIRMLVSHSNDDNEIEFNVLRCSPLALIPPTVTPNWYNKVTDAVAMMMDFRDNRSSLIVAKQSLHPLPQKTATKLPREKVDIDGAVALEIRFDKRTKLRQNDELRFFYAEGTELSPDPAESVDPVDTLLCLNSDVHQKENPHLFVTDNASHTSQPVSVEDLVVRSIDWEYSDEDGGAGSVGIVKEITAWESHGGKGLRVQWQMNGLENVYRYGADGRYDVQLLNYIRLHKAPFVIKGSSFSYEFLPSASSSATPELAERLKSNASSSQELKAGKESDDAKATKPDTFWGYKFYVIPHFSVETIGRRTFQSSSVRFGDSVARNLTFRHDQQLIKYINKKGQSKALNVTQLLHCPWSDLAPQDNELVRWPALMEIVSSARDDVQSGVETMTKPTVLCEPTATGAVSKSSSDGHNRLSKQFKLLQEFNSAVYRILPLVAFQVAVPVDASDKQFSLSQLVMEQRHRILSAVKRTVWDNALGRTNEAGASFELTLNRPKAMRFRSTGKTDVDGRHTLFSQAFRQLQAMDSSHFRRQDALYHVTFLGENAQDAGGPYRETFAQYCEELQSIQLPLMLPTPNSQHNVGVGREKWLLNPGALSSTTALMLEFLGKLMGAAIRSKQYLALNLAPLVWKRLAGEILGLEDLAAVDSMLINSMSKMRTIDRYGVTEEMFEDIVMETFTTLGADNSVIELKPGGTNLAVTFNSRCEYADLVEQARLHESDSQAQAVFRGLAKVVPAKLLACFSGSELELMVCGSPEVNVDLLEKCTEYSSCSPTDDHIVWFWRTLRDFSHEERSAFLRFVWGRSRLPSTSDEFPQRFKLQSFNQQGSGRSLDAYLPVAHTCFFSVEMPAYSSEEVLREKLLYAIYNCQEIDGDGDSVAANQLGWEE